MFKIILIAIAVIIVLGYIIGKRNSFENLRTAVKTQASNIGIYMQKRTDCLRDLLEIATISHKREVDAIKTLTPQEQFDQLMYMGQTYPALQSSQAYHEQMRQASILQQDIASCRALLNSNVQEYNKAIRTFPGLLIANMFGYKEEKLIGEEHLEANRQLDRSELDFSKYM